LALASASLPEALNTAASGGTGSDVAPVSFAGHAGSFGQRAKVTPLTLATPAPSDSIWAESEPAVTPDARVAATVKCVIFAVLSTGIAGGGTTLST
jgi:hypothetical protein